MDKEKGQRWWYDEMDIGKVHASHTSSEISQKELKSSVQKNSFHDIIFKFEIGSNEI